MSLTDGIIKNKRRCNEDTFVQIPLSKYEYFKECEKQVNYFEDKENVIVEVYKPSCGYVVQYLKTNEIVGKLKSDHEEVVKLHSDRLDSTVKQYEQLLLDKEVLTKSLHTKISDLRNKLDKKRSWIEIIFG